MFKTMGLSHCKGVRYEVSHPGPVLHCPEVPVQNGCGVWGGGGRGENSSQVATREDELLKKPCTSLWRSASWSFLWLHPVFGPDISSEHTFHSCIILVWRENKLLAKTAHSNPGSHSTARNCKHCFITPQNPFVTRQCHSPYRDRTWLWFSSLAPGQKKPLLFRISRYSWVTVRLVESTMNSITQNQNNKRGGKEKTNNYDIE